MCMMGKGADGKKETCEVAKSLAALEGQVKGIDSRVSNVEGRLDKMEGSISVGFTQVNTAVQNLAKQFGDRMNTLDKRIVEEKAKHDERVDLNREKWHDTLRKIALAVTYTVLAGAAAAMGVTIWEKFFIK